jgi:uncharacterized protein
VKTKKKQLDPDETIRKYYDPHERAYYFLVHHSRLVAQKAIQIAKTVGHLNPDMQFIEQAAMLHDIGILYTDAPRLGCHGHAHYLCHGYIGRQLLEKEGLSKHALVCERHVGVGITAEEIIKNQLPLPERDMVPASLEEIIICFADKFFSKNQHDLMHEKPVEKVRAMISEYGEDKLKTFDDWLRFFIPG